MGGFRVWDDARERRERQQASLRTVAVAASSVVVPGTFWLQLTFGQMRRYVYAPVFADAAVVVAVLLAVALVAVPGWTVRVLDRSLAFVLRVLLTPAAAALIALVHVANAPAARVWGRRRLVRVRPALRPWVDGGAGWREVDAWVPKPAHDVTGRHRNAAFALLGMLITRRDWLLAATFAALLVAAALLAAASPSSPVAPLLYTLF